MPTLHWVGKEAVLNHHEEVPFHLLDCDPSLSVGDPDSGNLLVEGDNLLALKALLPYYVGKVKCIYIDPPYNTGDESWVYNDNVNSPDMRDWLGKVVGKEVEDLSRHDKWLCMMYPRLCLLVQFLRPDGFLLVSLNEIEMANFRVMMEEILPTQKFIATLVWKSRRNLDNRSLHGVSVDHEYVVAFRNGNNSFRGQNKDMSKYSNPDNDPRGPWMSDNLVGLATKDRRPNLHYDLVDPETGDVYPPSDKGWRYSRETMAQKISEGRILWPANKGGRPRHKKFAADLQSNFAGYSSMLRSGNTNEGTEEMTKIMGRELFIFPKPRSLITTLLEQTTSGDDLILDSFAGSGTTAHAVLGLNKKDGQNRRFILVELDSKVAQTVTQERIQRVINGYAYKGTERTELLREKLTVTNFKKSSKIVAQMDALKQEYADEYDGFETKIANDHITFNGKRKIDGFKAGLGGGFRYCRLGETLFDADGHIRQTVTFADLARHVFFSETGAPLPADPTSPRIGIWKNTAIYLLFNGILGDTSPAGGNILTRTLLAVLPPHDGPKVIYANGCLLAPAYLQAHNITFRQTPYEIEVR